MDGKKKGGGKGKFEFDTGLDVVYESPSTGSKIVGLRCL